MLEVLEEINNKDFDTGYPILQKACKKYALLPKLLRMYIVNEDKIITPIKIMKMMKYYHVEKGNDISRLGEIGEFAVARIRLLKIREFGWQKANTERIEIFMNNINFLIDVYNKLKIEVQHKNQYHILKSCLILLSPVDVKWFVRMLCGKVETCRAWREVIKEYDMYKNE